MPSDSGDLVTGTIYAAASGRGLARGPRAPTIRGPARACGPVTDGHGHTNGRAARHAADGHFPRFAREWAPRAQSPKLTRKARVHFTSPYDN